jgi:hypothetical protein
VTAATKKFDGRLAARFRDELRESPPLRTEHKRAMKARNLPRWVLVLAWLVVIVGGPVMFFLLPVALLTFVVINVGPLFALPLSGLVSTVVSFCFAEQFLLRLQRSRHVSVASHLPMGEPEIAWRVWMSQAWPYFLTAYVAVLLHGVVAFQTGMNWPGWLLAIALGVLQGAVAIAVGTILAANRPRWNYRALAMTAFSLAFVLGVAATLRPWVNLPRKPFEAVLSVVTPGGWVAGVLGRAYLQGVGNAWWGLPASCFVVILAVPALRRLRSSYRILEFTVRVDQDVKATVPGPLFQAGSDSPASAGSPAGVIAELNADWNGASDRLSESAAEARIREGEFLRARRAPELGLVERFVYRWLSPRERNVVEFLAAEETRWMDGLLAAIGLMFALTACGLAFPALAGGMFVMSGAMTLAVVIGQPWMGFRRRKCGGNCVLHYANYPVGFREIFRAMFRAGMLRSLVLLPFVAMAYLAIGVALKAPPAQAFVLSLILLLLWVIVLTWAAIGFLTGFRFPAFRLKRIPLYLLPVVLIVASVAGGMMVAIWPALPPPVIARMAQLPVWGACLLVGSTLATRLYYESLDRRGLLDPVTRSMTPFEEKQFATYERMAQYQARAKIARNKCGRFWWLRPKLRRWAQGGDG